MSTQYEHYTSGYDNVDSVYGSIRQGQTFTPASLHTITSVKFQIKRVGSNGGNLTVALYATSGGVPTGSALSSVTVASNNISTSWGWVEFTLGTEYTLAASTLYAVIMKLPSGSSSNYIAFYDDRTSSAYANGTLVWTTNGGTSWTAESNQDMMFDVYGNPATYIKTIINLAKASAKVFNGLAIASTKQIDGLG